MINAGISIAGFSGFQRWDENDKQWKDIAVTVNYPADQNATDNPIEVGDVMVEPNGNVWEIYAANQDSSRPNNFTIDIELVSDTPSEGTTPSLGDVSRGGIITPANGVLLSHWDAMLVSGEVSRICQYFTMKNAVGLWHGDVPGVSLSDIGDDSE